MTNHHYKDAAAVLVVCVAAVLFILVTDNDANEVRPLAALHAKPMPSRQATATFDPCTGWWCTLRGVVYAGTTGPGGELGDASVELLQFSYCSPTSGHHRTTTGPDGAFAFEVFLHDTDGFRFTVEREGYEPATHSFGGFDCLFCSCPLIEIVLRPSPPAPALGKQATPRDGLHNNDNLTFTLALSGPGLRVRLWDPLPAAVRYVSDSITGTVTPAAVYSSALDAVLWQGTLLTDTAQVIRFQVVPGVSGTGSLDLAPPIVNAAWLTDVQSGKSAVATVVVNGYRFYLPLVSCTSVPRAGTGEEISINEREQARND